jgi:hypothetical protein
MQTAVKKAAKQTPLKQRQVLYTHHHHHHHHQKQQQQQQQEVAAALTVRCCRCGQTVCWRPAVAVVVSLMCCRCTSQQQGPLASVAHTGGCGWLAGMDQPLRVFRVRKQEGDCV